MYFCETDVMIKKFYCWPFLLYKALTCFLVGSAGVVLAAAGRV